MSKNPVVYVIQSLIGQGNVIPISTAVLDLTNGDYPAAALLTQAAYWTGKGTDWDGKKGDWFFKTHDEWQAEIRLSGKQVRRCIQLLKPLGLETCLKGMPSQTFYRVNFERFIEVLSDSVNGKTLLNPDVTKGNIKVLQKGTPSSDKREHLSIYTEITSETTTEKTSSPSSFAEKIVLIWNENCGQLPKADFLNSARAKKIGEYLSECTDEKTALEMFETAVKEAATDGFWISKRLKIDTMLKDSNVFSMVEGSRAKTVAQERSREGRKEVPPPITAPNPDAPPVGSKWVHPGSRMPLEVEFVKDNSVFFVDGGPIDECFVYEMVGWERL